MSQKEAKARIKINKLLEEAGWRFFDDENGRANIQLEKHTKITERQLNELGEDFEQTKRGFLDFLLLDERNFPLVVLEAKSEKIHPLTAKEQARKYAISQNCRFIILSNGNVHYLWDLERGNPQPIKKFPTPDSFKKLDAWKPNHYGLAKTIVTEDYIVRSQKHDYDLDPRWLDVSQRSQYLTDNGFRFLRKYQLDAITALQQAVAKGKDRFLFEMATGTGKTLTSAAIIKLFLKTGNARRVLFLVDRLELEDQGWKAFVKYLKNDFTAHIFKDNKDDWQKAEIVFSTIQSFIHNNKYKRIFKEDDFDLVISDEAHRSIGGNSRAVFEYFIGFKLGLTATPKDYLKKINSTELNQKDPRELERRILMDTYSTFGCENGTPTFRYSLLDGVRDGFLINPVVVDARTDITTQLLSDEGYAVMNVTEDGEEQEETFVHKHFEKKFFSEATNRVFGETFLKNALRDPITGEIGKSIVFCVSQNHAAKMAQILNELADKMYPGKYQSDFAMQVTSNVPDAQQMTINFTNNQLGGNCNFHPDYKTSKTRVCVTVGMMTTGYDCPDILNLCLMRPIFSPTDFVQIKGRGTRKHNLVEEMKDKELAKSIGKADKDKFKLFDFFANCEYFEEKFNYDEVLKLPPIRTGGEKPGPGGDPPPPPPSGALDSGVPDYIKDVVETAIGIQGMKVDRMYFEHFEDTIGGDEYAKDKIEQGDWDTVQQYIIDTYFEKPQEYYNLEKLRRSLRIDRRITLREILEKAFGLIPFIKSKEELLEDEFDKFDSRYLPEGKYFSDAKNFFKSYIIDAELRNIIESKQFPLLNTHPNGDVFRRLPPELRKEIPEYVKDNVSLNQFMT
jgi:type I restriction enzyme R subunit